MFRSELLYLEKDTYPTEDELFDAYKSVASSKILPIRKKIRELDLDQTPVDEIKEVGKVLWN